MNWKNVNDELPKIKVVKNGNLTTIEASKECLVFDGEDVFVDSYDLDEGFHQA